MNLDELQTARDRERQTDKLQQLRESFYQDAAEFIQQLRRERDRAAERTDDPFDSPEVSQLSDEISTAETTVDAIYEKRIGKLVKAASFDAAGLPSEADGMTAEEQDLFQDLVTDIKQNRTRVMNILDGENPDAATPEPGQPASSQAPENAAPASQQREPDETGSQTPPPEAVVDDSSESTDSSVSAADVMGSGSTEANEKSPQPDSTPPVPPEMDEPVPDDIRTGEDSTAESVSETPATDGGSVSAGSPSGEPEESPAPATESASEPTMNASSDSGPSERETVLITDDVETFVGFDDRDYDLACNDVVTLPAPNAEVLLKQDVAREL